MLEPLVGVLIALYVLCGFFFGKRYIMWPMWARLVAWVPLFAVAALSLLL